LSFFCSLLSQIDYVFLCVIAGCNCAPFIGFGYLLDRRRDAHVALRPLLASRSMGKDGIKVRVMGSSTDPIYNALRDFLHTIDHLAPDDDGLTSARASVENGGTHAAATAASSSRGSSSSRCVTVHVMESLAARDALFGPSAAAASIDNRFSLFIWSGSAEAPNTLPFTDDAVGQRLMRYLVLVSDWEKHSLCESLFSAIGVRVVDILHEKPTRAEFVASGAMGSSFRSAKAIQSNNARPNHFEPRVQNVAEEAEEEEASPPHANGNGEGSRQRTQLLAQ
jgi:hypothetical protein